MDKTTAIEMIDKTNEIFSKIVNYIKYKYAYKILYFHCIFISDSNKIVSIVTFREGISLKFL